MSLHDLADALIEGKASDKVAGTTIKFAGFDIAFDMRGNPSVVRGKIDFNKKGDYGHDPIFNKDGEPTGFVKMVPSGRIVPSADSAKLMGESSEQKFVYQVAGKSGTEEFASREALLKKYTSIGTVTSGSLRPQLQGQPKLKGLLGPMWNGEKNGVAYVRYETQEHYNDLSQ
ncbi:hypothetical protein UFOVP1382_50 [uncultured Caudovirales phage]|uniref:Uncharacterized protein n=1 Tax=uncultured Caudovirales phage TaxID=2100421 RepID=A0A6J5RXT6_9CAUD|nr:hypothetical protein UFOVP1382_50 [uncultured Caudovirales phage]